MPQLSAILITKNEAHDIEGCLQSLQGLASDIVVVDDHSTDDTVQRCRPYGVRLFTRSLEGFGPQKQFALEQATSEWVLSIDADERISPELAREIRAALAQDPDADGFEVRRNFYFLGRRLRHGGLGRDWVLRLVRRNRARFQDVRVHESLVINGKTARLAYPLEHHSYASLEEYTQKRERYAVLAAQDLWERGRRYSFWGRLRPAWEWIVRIILKGAWLDGGLGLKYAALSAGATWLRAVKLRALAENQVSRPLRRVLIARTDRLGDVLLTTPVSRLLREHFPQAHIAWLVRPYAAPILANNPDVDQILVDGGGSSTGLARLLRRERFDAAIVAYPRWRIAWAAWRAGIPVRIGPASKIYSALFKPLVWQHRSKGLRHEADYNLELLKPLNIPVRRVPTRLRVTADEKQWARKMLEGLRISFHKPVVCLHPGSGGSSSRWPLAHFMELGDRLQEAGWDVVVTGGPGESYQPIMIDHMRRTPIFIAAGSISIRQLAALMAWANLVVTNSTGPLHMAVALGIPTVSVYSPIPACHPTRWGPYPGYAEGGADHQVLLPDARDRFAGDLAGVTPERVFQACLRKSVFQDRVPAAHEA